MVALTVFASIQSHAQIANAEHVRILKTKSPGVVKLLYPFNTREGVTVKFTNEQGEIDTDQIKGNYEKRILKRYDLNKFGSSKYLVEVIAPAMKIVYELVPSNDNKTFTSRLVSTTYNHLAMAAK